MPHVEDEEAFRDNRDGPARPPSCNQRLDFTDTPPDAGDHDEAQPGNIFSPNTLYKSVQAGFTTAPPKSPEAAKNKKPRKRSKASSRQPDPQIPGFESINPESFPRVHEAGKPILSGESLRLAEGSMIQLQQIISFLEESLLQQDNPMYPAFVAKVPNELVDFVQDEPADVFFIAYEDVFNLFHSKRLDYNMVRLYCLDLARKMRRDNTPYVSIVDPYYMRESILEVSTTREKAKEYLVRVFMANKTKNYVLVPYFFE